MSDVVKWYKNLIDKFSEKYRAWDSDINSEELIKEVKSGKIKEFVGIIFRELGKLLDEQVYVKKNGEIVSPPQVIIFLSEMDDKEWRGEKRKALKEDLCSIYLEKVKEIAGKPISSRTVNIELKVDGTLESGKVRAEHRWEDKESETLPTVKQKDKVISVEPENEKTIPVGMLPSQVFYVEVWYDEKKQKELKFFQNQITIGRNSETKGDVDVHLSNDPRIARLHSTLEIDEHGNFWITAKGDNPTKVSQYNVPQNKTVQVGINEEIQIIDFTLKLRK